LGSRFVKTHEADSRVIDLYLQLRAIQQLPHVVIQINKDRNIVVSDKSDRTKFKIVSVEGILSFDVDMAKTNGGTWEAVIVSRRKKPIPIPAVELQDAVDKFLND
jgi:hypothetical protein